MDWPLTGISHDFQLLLYIYSLLPSTLDKCILPILQSEAPDQAHDLQFPKWLVPLAPFATVTLVHFGTCLLRTIISLFFLPTTTTTTTIRLPPSGALFLPFLLFLFLFSLFTLFPSFHSLPSHSFFSSLTRSRARSPVCLLDPRKTRCIGVFLTRFDNSSGGFYLSSIQSLFSSIIPRLLHNGARAPAERPSDD